MLVSDIELIKLYCQIDDFCKLFFKYFNQKLISEKSSKLRKERKDRLKSSEIMCILILYNNSSYDCFKNYYIEFAKPNLQKYFPNMPCYARFTHIQKIAFMPLSSFLLEIINKNEKTGCYYIDSTYIPVCKNQRIRRHKTFKGLASRGKSTMGWFFGFKLHLLINHKAEVVNMSITKGNGSDLDTVLALAKTLKGKLFGDKGYISKKIKNNLLSQGLELFTKTRKNMKKQEISNKNRFLLSKRGIVETVIGSIKGFFSIISHRYKTPVNFFMNIISGLIAYDFKQNKPKINFNIQKSRGYKLKKA